MICLVLLYFIFANGTEIPKISFQYFGKSSEHNLQIASQIHEALKHNGFFIITDHSLEIELLQLFDDVTLQYFAQSSTEKRKIPMTEDYPYGFTDTEILSHSETQTTVYPDLKETFQVMLGSINTTEPAPLWPELPLALQSIWTEYYRQCEQLTLDILYLLTLSLDIPPTFFTPYFNDHQSVLRGIHYPSIQLETPANQYRCSQHSDWGAITLLRQNEPIGLEAQTTNDIWIPVRSAPNEVVVNIGDLMERWTNNLYRSTKHRVVVDSTTKHIPRLSSAYFGLLSKHAEVHCIPRPTSVCQYAPINAFQYLMEKHQATLVSSPTTEESNHDLDEL